MGLGTLETKNTWPAMPPSSSLELVVRRTDLQDEIDVLSEFFGQNELPAVYVTVLPPAFDDAHTDDFHTPRLRRQEPKLLVYGVREIVEELANS